MDIPNIGVDRKTLVGVELMVVEKQAQELMILEAIYNVKSYAYVHPQDRPDFLISFRDGQGVFGIEITELFLSDASARLEKLPTYMDELFAGEPVRHKDDLLQLTIGKGDVRDADGKLKQTDVPAVLQKLPPPNIHSDKVAERVREKSGKIQSYLEEAASVNLIIMDWMDTYSRQGEHYSVSSLMGTELRSAIIESDFKEIYLVSAKTQTYRPLRVLLTWESFYLFCRALDTFDDIDQVGWGDIVPLYTLMVREYSGYDAYVAGVDDGLPFTYHKGVGVYLGTDGGTELIDYNDHPAPVPTDIPRFTFGSNLLNRFRRHYVDFTAIGWDFSVEMRIPVKQEVPGYGKAQHLLADLLDPPDDPADGNT